MAQFENAGFKNHVSVKPVPDRMEAGSVEEMVENLMLGKDMFCKGYSEQEVEGLRSVLGGEIEKLEAFERTEWDVGIAMEAWVAVAWK